jgi:hypothetical protein
MSMTIGDEVYQPKRFPHAEAQSVVPAMTILPALFRFIAMRSAVFDSCCVPKRSALKVPATA